MASFDAQSFLNITGNTGADPITAFGTSFGVPSCMLSLAKDALSLLPFPALALMQQSLAEGKARAREFIAGLYQKLLTELGLVEDENGGFKLPFGADSDVLAAINDLVAMIGFITEIANEIQDIIENINDVIACFKQFKEIQKAQAGNIAAQQGSLPLQAGSDLAFANAQLAVQFINDANRQLTLINEIFQERLQNPDLEPCIPDSAEFDQLAAGSNIRRCPIEDPGLAQEGDGVFRLTYGPPVSVAGQYVLTSDGLYYDSRSGGLDPVFLSISGIVQPGDKWKYDYAPNLGGKGDQVSIESLNKFTDNIFDLDDVDDSQGMQLYYDNDHFLAVLRQQRDKHAYDLSGELVDFISQYGENSAIVNNQRQVIISEIANHNDKINRRKKQIEVIVKVPNLYGDEGPTFAPGDIPINDFSVLEKYNLAVDLEKQKALIFSQAEVNDIVLPLTPKFVKSSAKAPSVGFEHLTVPNVGKGSIIYSPSGGVEATVLSLTDQIATDGLFAIYNFLDTRTTLPSSTDFNLTNCATNDMYNNAQLIGTNPQSIFFSGLAIPYLEGIVKNKSTFTQGASALGSVVRLPDTEEFRELTYKNQGFSMECWVHVPNITDAETGWLSGTTSSLTKVLLASENTGVASGVSAVNYLGQTPDLDFLENKKGTDFVKGLICGFTRDRRITQESIGYSNDNAENDPASSLSFFMAPTISRDASSLSWINNDDCNDIESFYKMKVDLSSNSYIGNVSSQFVLIAITVDPPKDLISFYADGNLLTTSAMSTVFGNDARTSIGLPSFKKPNSFEYTTSTVDGPTTIKTGPKNNPFYTPWIVGGGWTDGMYLNGNFMGGDRGGIVSGLRGHIGSLKFYSKPLNTEEITQNYKAQQGFFKNIKM